MQASQHQRRLDADLVRGVVHQRSSTSWTWGSVRARPCTDATVNSAKTIRGSSRGGGRAQG